MTGDRYTAWRDTLVGDACLRLAKTAAVVAVAVALVVFALRAAEGSTVRPVGSHSAGNDGRRAYDDGHSGQSRRDGGAMTSTKRTLTVVVCLATLTVMSACGGEDEPDLPDKPTSKPTSSATEPSPTPSGSTSSTTPPPTDGASTGPDGADLDRAQQSAYDNALEDYDEVQRVVRALNANPAPTQATADQLKRVTYNPASDQFFASIQRYARAKVRVVGQREVLWRSPVRVDLGAKPRATVVWRQCLALGTTQVIYGASPIPQKEDRTIGEVTALTDENGFWKVSNVRSKGAC